MGLFDFLKSRTEQQVEENYLQTLVRNGVPRPQAEMIVRQALRDAKSEPVEQWERVRGLGNKMVQDERSKPEWGEILRKARSEGVTDEDIRFYWNQPWLVRRMWWVMAKLQKVATITRETEELGRSSEEAAAQARRLYPYFGGDPSEADRTGEDRPLPPELWRRIEAWVARQDLEEVRARLQGSSSFNAVVRQEIRAGRL